MTAAVDPSMAAILAHIAAQPAVDYRSLPLPEARQTFETVQRAWQHCPFPLADVADIVVPGAEGNLRARLYRPVDNPNLPLVLYAHGGGWTFGSVDTHDGLMRHLAYHSGCAVLGIDYRLAPEHPHPAALQDVLAVLAHVERGGMGAPMAADRVALAGDSAGATLGLAAMVVRRDRGEPVPATAALFYGCFAPLFDTDSHRLYGQGRFLLTTDMMRWYWANYLGGDEPGALSAPLGARLESLPPLYLNAAGLDPLCDDTLILSQRLARAGVAHRLDVTAGVVHGYLRMTRDLPAAGIALRAAGRHLAETFNDKTSGRI